MKSLLCFAVISMSAVQGANKPAQYTHNIAFDGPFTGFSSINENAPRRLLSNESYATDGIMFYHGIASGEPTDTDSLVCPFKL